jgi:hypothetical protein
LRIRDREAMDGPQAEGDKSHSYRQTHKWEIRETTVYMLSKKFILFPPPKLPTVYYFD